MLPSNCTKRKPYHQNHAVSNAVASKISDPLQLKAYRKKKKLTTVAKVRKDYSLHSVSVQEQVLAQLLWPSS